MKKITSLCLSALLAFSAMLTPINAQAREADTETIADTAIEEQCEPETSDEASAKLEELEASGAAKLDSGTCGENAKWILYENGVLKVYGKGDMTNYNGPDRYITFVDEEGNWRLADDEEDNFATWSPYRDKIKKVVIESGVTSIGDYAFIECENLQSVAMADTVTYLGEFAFYNCDNLQNITFSEKLSVVESEAFAYCEKITGLKFTSALDNIHLYAFKGCTGLKSVEFVKGVVKISNYAFYECVNLKSINLPNNLQLIGKSAFEFCTSLSSVSIPASVTTIGKQAFTCCTSLKSISVASGNEKYSSEDGVLFNKDKLTLVACPTGKTGTYIIPVSVKYIKELAFGCCANLTSVTIPNSVVSIGRLAFTGCKKLTAVNIPDSVKIMGSHIFSDCENLNKVTWPYYFDDIPTATFYGCTSLETIEIPRCVTTIEKLAFGQCTSLKEVKMRGGVTKIGEAAFDSCPNLTNVTVPSSVTDIEDTAFGYNNTIECSKINGRINADVFCINWRREKMKNFTIRGLKGSAAETYAKENGFTFDAFEKCIGICGDIDSNDTIAAKDAFIVYKAVNKRATLTKKQALLADANEDGKINSTDILLLQRYLVGTYDFSNIGQKIYK